MAQASKSWCRDRQPFPRVAGFPDPQSDLENRSPRTIWEFIYIEIMQGFLRIYVGDLIFRSCKGSGFFEGGK